MKILHHHYSDQNDHNSKTTQTDPEQTEIISQIMSKTNKQQIKVAALCTFCLHKLN